MNSDIRRRSQARLRSQCTTSVVVLGVSALIASAMLPAEEGFRVVTGQAFERAVPKDFYLEGDAIPVEKRNTALLKTPLGARVLIGLLDTSGYSSQIQQKYIGMLIAEGRVTVCSIDVAVGSYGFGLRKPIAESHGEFLIYDQAGTQVGNCVADADRSLKLPKPLQVTTAADGTTKLCLGRYCIALRSKE